MPHVQGGFPRLSVVLRPCALAVAATVATAGIAEAQSGEIARVVGDPVEISWSRYFDNTVLMTADPGTELVVIHTDGDRYRHLDSNWYLVQLPRDAWGKAPAGWVAGRYVEIAPMPPRARPVVEAPRSAPAAVAAPAATAPAADAAFNADRMPVAETGDEPIMADVTVHFAFDRSDLLDDARVALTEAAAVLTGDAVDVAIALEGHADATGPESYNETLGRARAEAVKAYLAEAHGIAADRMTVVSLGESQPAAPNDTADGRAENRRVVLRVMAGDDPRPTASAQTP